MSMEQLVNRRDVLQIGMATGIAAFVRRPLHAEGANPVVMTVRGPIKPEERGPTLLHEHILVDFIGAREVSRDRYNAEKVYSTALPHLKRIREQGIRTLVD